MPSRPRAFDVVAIGNALVDVLARAGDDLIGTLGLRKGTMTLADAEQVARAGEVLNPETQASGGSAANTAVGIASLDGSAAFIGRVDGDELGKVFIEDINRSGVFFESRAAGGMAQSEPGEDGVPVRGTGRCFVVVTPDAERTMATYLGVAGRLNDTDIDEELIAAARVTYLEGYLWDLPATKKALRRAMEVAHRAGRLVALSLSDPFVAERHREELIALIESQDGRDAAYVDIVFGNEEEVKLLYGTGNFDEAAERLARAGVLAVLTRGAAGSVVRRGSETVVVEARKAAAVVDTTGAGDLFAAGFLVGLTRGAAGNAGDRVLSGKELFAAADLSRCAALGSLAAAEVISHMGSRPLLPLAQQAREEGLLGV